MHPGPIHNLKIDEEKAHNVIEKISTVLFNQVAYVVGIVSSLFNIPQVISIWVDKSAEGVSVLSWVGFALASLFWLAYAIRRKESALIITFSLSLFFQMVIVVGAILW